jgi:hypothetical protein
MLILKVFIERSNGLAIRGASGNVKRRTESVFRASLAWPG